MSYETHYESRNASLNVSEGTPDDYRIRLYHLARDLRGPRVEPVCRLANNIHIILSNLSESKARNGWKLPGYARIEDLDLIILNDIDVKRHGRSLWLTPSESAKLVRRRILKLSGALVLILVLLLWKSAYLALSDESRNNANFALMTRTPISLSRLEDQSKLINTMSRHIGDYKLNDIIGLLSDTANIASNVNIELKAKFDAWGKINESAAVDAEKYRAMQRNVAVTSELQAKEIDRLHEVLAKAEKPTLLFSVMGLIFSFLGGVATSITADKLKNRINSSITLCFKVIDRIRIRFLAGK